jgi:prophage antirepressor-like protein
MNDSTKNTFFLDIFNKILKVNNNEIIILYNKDGEPWFGLRDVIIALGYNDIKHFTNYIHIDTTNIKKYDDINKDIKHNTNYVKQNGNINKTNTRNEPKMNKNGLEQ